MRLVLSVTALFLLAVACRSGSGGTGIATSGEDVSTPETSADAAVSPNEDRNRAAEREARLEAKAQEAEMREQARVEAAAEANLRATKRWRAGAQERLRAEAEQADQQADEGVPRK